MTREDINDIINAICPNDEDYEKPCISPKYLRQELEQLALDQRQWNEEPTTKNDLGVDCIDRNSIKYYSGHGGYMYASKGEIDKLPSVTPQPRCRECKWWKDSDGAFRRGIGAESQCPINTHAVYSGEGYCYKFSPKLEQEPVIDKIRAEIRDIKVIHDEYSQRQNDYCDGVEFAKRYVLQIIDKYKAESEEE